MAITMFRVVSQDEVGGLSAVVYKPEITGKILYLYFAGEKGLCI